MAMLLQHILPNMPEEKQSMQLGLAWVEMRGYSTFCHISPKAEGALLAFEGRRMSVTPLLFMPFLHKELCPATLPSSLLHLWPGLPNPQKGFYTPADFPLSPQNAAQYVEHMRDVSLAAADDTPVHSLLAAEKQARHPGILKEAQDIAAFAQGAETETPAAYHMREARLAAQKALLRVWLLEERHIEIQTLEQRCQTLSDDFAAMLGVEMEDEEKDALLLTQNTQRLETVAVPSVPWRFVLENAALFLPEHCTLLFADSSISLELRELALHFAKVQAKHYLSGPASTHTPELAEAPLWKALGMQRPHPGHPWLAKVFSFLLWNNAQ